MNTIESLLRLGFYIISIVPYRKFSNPNNFNSHSIFKAIYKTNYWGSEESFSGLGSELNNTRVLRSRLPQIFSKYNIKTMLDVPCGDFNFMAKVNMLDVNYTGGDIVEKIIEDNNCKYKDSNHVKFEIIDATKDVLPKVDLILCKDLLQHLSYEDVYKVLLNFKKSNSKYLLVTCYPLTLKNWDIHTGYYRPLNLRKKPFFLPQPMEKIHEHRNEWNNIERDKFMYLYDLNKLNLEFTCLK
ncbi:MAG: hypothetical protein LBC39_02005 [Methanobrevibacter sp.]|jgi:hypothetical protein|nr:hypothetical protein [Candidatus Methanovirga aequatorialis]